MKASKRNSSVQPQPFFDALTIAKQGVDSAMNLMQLAQIEIKRGPSLQNYLKGTELQSVALNSLITSFNASLESISREVLRNQQQTKLRKRIPKRKRRKLTANPITP